MDKNKALGLVLFLLGVCLPADSFADFAFGSFNMRKWETGDLNYVTTYNDNLQILNDELLNITTGQFALTISSLSVSTNSLQLQIYDLISSTKTSAQTMVSSLSTPEIIFDSATINGVSMTFPNVSCAFGQAFISDGAGNWSCSSIADAALNSTQTFTGINTFENEVNFSSGTVGAQVVKISSGVIDVANGMKVGGQPVMLFGGWHCSGSGSSSGSNNPLTGGQSCPAGFTEAPMFGTGGYLNCSSVCTVGPECKICYKLPD